MRTIKFRAWVEEVQQMYSNEDLASFPLEEIKTDSNWKYMQFTGLLDKNGKEIYEGDIVGLFLKTQIFEVKWCDERGGYFLDDVVMSGGSEPCPECLGNNLSTTEVMGNIFTDPDLLTNTQ